MDLSFAKQVVGKRAALLVEDGMIVGLGSGSTAASFIEALAERCQKGLSCTAVPSSLSSKTLAHKLHIPLASIDQVPHIDCTFDGADEIDPQFRMIKGGGGAHVREKILASASKKLYILVDPSKHVPKLGTRPLPVEIVAYGAPSTAQALLQLGWQGTWRKQRDGALYLTENGNLLFDITFPCPLDDPETIDAAIQSIPGVVDTGFFFQMAHTVLTGHPSGEVDILPCTRVPFTRDF